jgi:hypothetical protein
MPPKKAASGAPAAAGGESKKAASPKTEKPAAAEGNAAEKKPAQQKNQPRQGKDHAAAAGGDHARSHKDNAAAHHNKESGAAYHNKESGAASSPAGEKRTFSLSDDPEEAAIQKKLNVFDDQISEHRTQIVCSPFINLERGGVESCDRTLCFIRGIFKLIPLHTMAFSHVILVGGGIPMILISFLFFFI